MSDREVNIQDLQNYAPNADAIVNFNTRGTRMDAYFRQLLDEIEKGVKAEVFEALDYYRTKLDGSGKHDIIEEISK